jgi:hypothetical protein
MTRIVLIASLLALSSAAAVNHAYAQTRQQCEDTASTCLSGCSRYMQQSWTDSQGKTHPGPGPNSDYARCMRGCDSERNRCLTNSPYLPGR